MQPEAGRQPRSGWPWHSTSVLPNRPPAPQALEQDVAPEAGRLYGPKGQLMSIVRHKKTYKPFGFQGSKQ